MTSRRLRVAFLFGWVVGPVAPSPVGAELRHHWPLDETSGLVAADVASGHDGALVNFNNNDDSHWVDGEVHGALSLGTGSTLGNHLAVELPLMDARVAGGFTIMLWIRPGDIVRRRGEYQLFTSPGDVIGFTIYNDVFDGRLHERLLLFWDGSVRHIVVGTTKLEPGLWHHVAVTSTGVGGERQLYVNGAVETKRFFVAQGGVDVGNANGWSAGGSRIGAFNPVGGRWHDSTIDDVRIYDTALSADEIAEVFSADAPKALVRGDADSGGQLNITDAVFTLNHLFLGGPPPSCFDAADADDSGQLNITDPVFTLNFLFLGGGRPPAPGPEDCGADPTADELTCEQFGPCETR